MLLGIEEEFFYYLPMSYLRTARIAAFRARLLLAEYERNRIVEKVTKSQVNLAEIAERLDRTERDIHAITNELKLLGMPEADEA
jgi:hypothetical protein